MFGGLHVFLFPSQKTYPRCHLCWLGVSLVHLITTILLPNTPIPGWVRWGGPVRFLNWKCIIRPMRSKPGSSSTKEARREFPWWLSGLRTRLVSMRMEVQSLASLSVLRIQRCHKRQCMSRCSLDLAWLWLWCMPAAGSSNVTPSLRTSICCRCGHKKKKK